MRSFQAPPTAILVACSLVVDASVALARVASDPLASVPAWTAEGNQALARFGVSVATAGDVDGDGFSDVVVGAPRFDDGRNEEGRAFLFRGSAVGPATAPSWTAESGQIGAELGFAVATAGDVNGDGHADVLVAAVKLDAGQADEGGVFLYLGSAAGLAASPAWSAQSDQPLAFLGSAIATAGDVNGDGFSDVVAGAFAYDAGESDEGRAFLWLGSATGLAATPAWTAESDQASALFGKAVSTAGDVNGDGFSDVAVGAYAFDAGQSDEGRAFLYLGSATGLGSLPAWTAESDQSGAQFGFSVSTAGDVDADGFADLVVGAPGFTNGQSGEGRTSLFRGSASGLLPLAAWNNEGQQTGAELGFSVATAGDPNADGCCDVIAGARSFDAGELDEGRVLAWLGSTNGLATLPAWSSEGNQAGAELGFSVTTAGDVDGDGYSDVVTGAPGFDAGEVDEGRAFVHLGAAAGLATTPAWTATNFTSQSEFGDSVASAGDVNGDGFADVLVGAPRFDGGFSDQGRAYAYLGSATGPGTTASWTTQSNQSQAWYGFSVASAGDVNGDGYSDAIVGAPLYDVGPGRAFLYLGSAAGLSTAPAWTNGADVVGYAGYSVASAGDVDADGYCDVVVGANSYSNGQSSEGAAFVYLGSAAGLGATPVWHAESNQYQADLGASVASAGDVDGDGFSDVVVGAYSFDVTTQNEGYAFAFRGKASGLSAFPFWSAGSHQEGALFGNSVATAGDVNGDGFSDVVVGAPYFDDELDSQGRVFVYLGGAGTLGSTPAWTAEGDYLGAAYAHSVASAGDSNGDGFSDVIVGARHYDTHLGRVFGYLGSANGLPQTGVADWIVDGNVPGGYFGSSVAPAGDVNGDGTADVIVGSPQGIVGHASVFLGNRGVRRLPRQRRADDSAPIAPLGKMTGASFLSRLLARSPFGRGHARLEVETKPFGVAFDGGGTIIGPQVDTGIAGFDASVTVAWLASATPYRWRARIVHDAATTPFLPAGPWFTPAANASTETDLRTAACGEQSASSTAYGTGKPGSQGVPVLASAAPPSLGEATGLALTGGSAGQGPVFLFAGLSPAALPFDGGTLLVIPFATFVLPALGAGGALSLPLTIPSDAALCGIHVYFQAGFVDPAAAGPLHTALTNGLDWRLGS